MWCGQSLGVIHPERLSPVTLGAQETTQPPNCMDGNPEGLHSGCAPDGGDQRRDRGKNDEEDRNKEQALARGSTKPLGFPSPWAKRKRKGASQKALFPPVSMEEKAEAGIFIK